MKTSRIAYAGLALIAGLLSLCLFSCSRNVGQPDARPNASLVSHPVGVDSASTAPLPIVLPAPSTAKPSILRRLFPAKSTATAPTPRKCKGCTFNYVQGNQSTSTVGKKSTAAVGAGATSTSTTTGKKSGPAVIASDSVDQTVAGPNAQQVTTRGNGNQVDAQKQDTTKEALGPLAVLVDNLSGPLGAVLGLAAAAGIVVFLLRRKAAKTIV